MRLTSSMWVSAYVRRCHVEGAYAVVRRRGASEAGAIFVRLDHLDGRVSLFAPALQSMMDEETGGRTFEHVGDSAEPSAWEARLQSEIKFDSDLWIVEVEDRAGRHFLDLTKA